MTFISVLALVLPAVASAGQTADSLAVADTVKQSEGFDAASYKMQKRYRPKDACPFYGNRFRDNMFFNFSWSWYQMIKKDYASGPYGSFSVGKWLNRFNGLRLGVGFGNNKDTYSGYSIHHFDVRLSYLFDFSAYARGYNPSRLISFSGVVGLGYVLNWKKEPLSSEQYPKSVSNSIAGHIGINMRMRAFKDVDIFIEPLFEIGADNFNLARNNNWRRISASFNGAFGVSYKLRPEERGMEEDPGHDWSLAVTTGTMFQNSKQVWDIGIGNTMGWDISVGVSKHYRHFFAWRLSAFYGYDYWKVSDDGVKLRSHYFGARLEAMFDIVAAIKKRECAGSFTLFAGPEAGGILKCDRLPVSHSREIIKAYYAGISMGIQGKYRFLKNYAVFAEPRCSFVPYYAPNDSKTSVYADRSYYDALLVFNVGFEYWF